MLGRIGVMVVGVLLSYSTSGKEIECNSECKLLQVEQYFQNIDKVFRKDSSSMDIDRFLTHLHDEVKYEHIEYGADFTKDKWRNAFLKQLEMNSYTDGPDSEARVINIIYGKHHAAVEYSYGKVKSDGVWEKGEAYFALFGFKDGRISLIREYW